MRARLALMMLPVAGCSSLLGIETPSAREHDGGMDPAGDHLVFNVGDFQIAQQQSARVKVTFAHQDGTMEDVTTRATFESDNPPIVKIDEPGVISSADTQSGAATITASLGGATPATVRVTVTAVVCHPVINEFVTATSASANEEWIEVHNPCTVAIDVTGWTLDYRGATTTGVMDSTFIATLPGPMDAGAFLLFGSLEYMGPKDGSWPNSNGILGGTNGAIGLRDGAISTGKIIDSVGYGTVADGANSTPRNPFLEGMAAPAMSPNVSASRSPFDGKDDDSGMLDFKITPTPTPGAPNATDAP